MSSKNPEVRRQVIRYIIYLVVVLSLTFLAFYLSLNGKVEEIINTIKQANVYILLIVFGVVIASIFLRSMVLFVLTRTYDKKYFFHRAMAIDQIGALYRFVTPAGLGSHFMELFTYRKQGIRLSSALSILACYSIIYQIVLILYNFITLIFKGSLVVDIGYINLSFDNSVSLYVPLWLLVTAGFIINLTVIGFILFISYWNGFYRFIKEPVAKLLFKMKIIKDLEAYQNHLEDSRDNFRANIKHILTNWPVLIISIICFAIYITISYSTPYIIGQALGNTSSNANFWDSVLLSNFHQMITCVIPIPGTAFSSELFFYQLFYPGNDAINFYSSEDIAKASLLLWRSLMFIIPLAISALYTIIYRPRKLKVNEDEQNQED